MENADVDRLEAKGIAKVFDLFSYLQAESSH